MTDASNMPARIWITAEDRSASWAGSFTRWHASDLDHGDEYPVYHRADIVKSLVEALKEARDALNGAPNTIGLHSQIDSALNSYREASNDKA